MGSTCAKQNDNDSQAEEVDFFNIGDDADPRGKGLVRRRLVRELKKTADPTLKAILANAGSAEFFGKLNAFFTNKQGIEALRATLMPNNELDAVEVKATGLFHDGNQTQIRLEFYQRQLDGKSPSTSIEDIYAVAEKVLPLFEQLLIDTAEAVGADVTVKMSPAGLKAKDRALQKAEDDYSDRECPDGGPAVGWVFDIVRGTLSCGSVGSVKAVIALLVKDTRITITIKFKNRFKHPTPNGFCDMLLQVVFADGGLVHTCEIQVHLRPITEYAVEHKSHDSYDYFRVLFQGSMDTVVARLNDVSKIVGADFVPAEDGVEAAAVLEDVVVDVLESKNDLRMDQLYLLANLSLAEFDLAVYVGRALLAVAIEEYGPDHPDVGGSYNNIALVLQKQGKLEEAVEMNKKALAIRTKALGKEHLFVGAAYNNIAVVLKKQGKLAEALEMFKKALAIKIKALGEEHPDVGMTYNNIAVVLKDEGRLEEAMEMHLKALAIRIKALGKEHPDVGRSFNNIAIVLEAQGKPDDSLQMYENALAIRIKAFGQEHPDVGDTCYNMAQLAEDQDQLAKALELFTKAVTAYERSYGAGHSETVDAKEQVTRVRGEMA